MTNHTTEELKEKVRDGVELLQALRDQVSLKVHLGGMEAKDEWVKLEPKIAEAEKLVEEVSHGALSVVDDLIGRMKKLSAALD